MINNQRWDNKLIESYSNGMMMDFTFNFYILHYRLFQRDV